MLSENDDEPLEMGPFHIQIYANFTSLIGHLEYYVPVIYIHPPPPPSIYGIAAEKPGYVAVHVLVPAVLWNCGGFNIMTLTPVRFSLV